MSSENKGETKTRPPIAATYNSPGPVYSLPTLTGKNKHDPRSVHACGPAYVFGMKGSGGATDSSPGPIYNPDAKLTRTGRDTGPRAAVSGRPNEPNYFRTPGPSLGIESESGHTGAPAYSFGGRHDIKPNSNTPGPNSYSVPSTLGKTVQSNKRQAPSYSVKSRAKPDDVQVGPGPGAYKAVDTNNVKKGAPKYSMAGKHERITDGTAKPGPGAHSPEQVRIDKREAPKFSFGVKHSPYTVPLIVPVND